MSDRAKEIEKDLQEQKKANEKIAAELKTLRDSNTKKDEDAWIATQLAQQEETLRARYQEAKLEEYRSALNSAMQIGAVDSGGNPVDPTSQVVFDETDPTQVAVANEQRARQEEKAEKAK